jgi:hypothetical protein
MKNFEKIIFDFEWINQKQKILFFVGLLRKLAYYKPLKRFYVAAEFIAHGLKSWATL